MKNTIIIYSNYSKLKQKGERIYIETNKTKTSIPLSSIDGILIFGKTTLTSDAISLCMKKNIPILLFTFFGQPKAQILPPTNSESTRKRIKQFELYFNKRLSVAKLFVDRKCQNIELIFGISLLEIRQKIKDISSIEDLLGLEGSATRQMFKKFEEIINKTEFKFSERTYNPPKDEINALLSFIYTLGYNLAIGLLLSIGYDVYVSFLHTKRGRHSAFASDILEVVRPALTYFTAELVSKKIITKEDFTKEKETFLLKKQAVAKILDVFQENKDNLILTMKKVLKDFDNL